MKTNFKENGYIPLLRNIFGAPLKDNINLKNLKTNFDKVFYSENEYGKKIPPRIVKAIKLYYQLEKNSKGLYCKSYKHVGEELDNLTTNKKGVTQARAREIVLYGLRHLRHPTRSKYLKQFFIISQTT